MVCFVTENEEIRRFKEEIMNLKKNYLFSKFSGNSLKTLFLLFQVVRYKKGEQIIKEGEPSDRIYLIREGEFKVRDKFNGSVCPCWN